MTNFNKNKKKENSFLFMCKMELYFERRNILKFATRDGYVSELNKK